MPQHIFLEIKVLLLPKKLEIKYYMFKCLAVVIVFERPYPFTVTYSSSSPYSDLRFGIRFALSKKWYLPLKVVFSGNKSLEPYYGFLFTLK